MENNNTNQFYGFTPEAAYKKIEKHWQIWHANVKPQYYIVGMSGGIDSSCVAALACKIFGKEHVVGVSLPCDGQSDMWAVDKIFNHLGIKRIDIDIGDAFANLKTKIENNGLYLTDICTTNMPARLRMTTLFGVAQCMNGIVVNTCNRSESVLSNDTLFGDDCGSYAPIQRLTKTEVKAIAAWLGIPQDLVEKTPIDGLQPLSDEDRIGIKYDTVDAYLRSTRSTNDKDRDLILSKFVSGKFKMETVHIAGPEFTEYPDAIRDEFGL